MGGGRAWRHKTKDAKPLKLLARRPGSLIFSRQIIILMKKLISLFSFLLGAHSVFADAEMDRLKTSYEAAVERSVIPIRNTYEKELLKLRCTDLYNTKGCVIENVMFHCGENCSKWECNLRANAVLCEVEFNKYFTRCGTIAFMTF